MSARYEYFTVSLAKNYKEVRSRLGQYGLSFDSYCYHLPPQVFEPLWIAPLESEGFSSALSHICSSVEKHVSRSSQNQQAGEMHAQVKYILEVIAPCLITHKSQSFSTQEIVARVKELKKSWNLKAEICANLIAHLECSEEMENNGPQSKKLKLINDFLVVFETNQSKLTYKSYGLQLLSQSISEILFDLKRRQQNYEDCYKKVCVVNREKIIYFFSKIKKKEATCVSILAWIVDPERNLTRNQKMANICMLFLFTENWDRFKESQSRLKEPAVVDILAKAFERMMYLAYDQDQAIMKLFLHFSHAAKFTLYEEIKQAIAYHLMSLFKLQRYMQKTAIAKLIESIWSEKMKGVRLGDLYLDYSPSFTSRTQKGDDQRTLEQAETRSIASKQSQGLTIRSKGTSKNKPNRATRNNNLHRRVRTIEDELKRCNFQRIYLMVDSIKRFYFSQYEEKKSEQASRNLIIGLLVLLIKKIQGKIDFRYDCTLLKKCIYLQLMQLKERCFDASYQFNEKSQILGLFECCYLDKGQINFQGLIKFHEKNNYQENLETVFNLKSLCDELNSNSACSGSKQESYEEMLLQSECFEGKVYLLYKNDFSQGKKTESKRLAIISRLLLLKSRNITNNLLVNYIYCLLKQQKVNDMNKKKLESVSKLINQEITNGQDQELNKLFLKMGEIFEEFDNKASEAVLRVNDKSIEVKYFQFLRRKEHAKYYYAYSQIYLKMNYLKESLYFLQMHGFNTKNVGKEMVYNAIGIYQRLNMPFKTYLSSILRELKIQPSMYNSCGLKKSVKYNFQQILTCFMNRIDLESICLKQYESLYVNDSPRIEVWLNMFYPFLQLFIEEIHLYKEPEQISQSLKKYKIFLKYINLKLQLLRQPLMPLSQNRLNQLTCCIQLLRNPQDRVHFYQQFLFILKDSDMDHLQNAYLEDMLKSKSYAKFYEYLRQGLREGQPDAHMETKYLTYLIKYYFQISDHMICLPMVKILQERQQQIGKSAQIFHIQLECRHNAMLNFTIQEYLNLIQVCISSSHNQPPGKDRDNHFKYYFKIFRMLFNRYIFSSVNQNELFLNVYFKFIDCNKILTSNQEYLNETIFYLLRFMFQKFYYGNVGSHGTIEKIVIERFKGKHEHFVPFCNYLIKRISFNTIKNNAIKCVLKTVLTEHPQECIWIISFLKNFAAKSPKAARLSNDQNNQIERLAQLYKQVFQTLYVKKTLNLQHLNWIDGLVKLSLSETEFKKQKLSEFKNASIPTQLRFMFNQDFYFNRTEDVRILSNGKSAPLQIIFHLVHIKERYYKTVKVIIKGNVGTKKYRMQSNTANFFEEIGIFDNDITYKVIHLSKYLVSLEHRQHCGTINSIINNQLPEVKKIQRAILVELQKRRQMTPERRLLEIFTLHCSRPDHEIKFSEIIYHKARNIRDWWKRYNNFIRTHAQWSFLGYVVGLGDRHCDNILITEDAKLIHIDFEYALDTGLKLACPEWVPFRLTSAFIEPLGVLGVFGIYYAEMLNTVRQFEEREDSIWKALSNFIGSMDTNVCEEIIQRSKFAGFRAGSSEEAVGRLIGHAKSPELLRLMFEGWRAYL